MQAAISLGSTGVGAHQFVISAVDTMYRSCLPCPERKEKREEKMVTVPGQNCGSFEDKAFANFDSPRLGRSTIRSDGDGEQASDPARRKEGYERV